MKSGLTISSEERKRELAAERSRRRRRRERRGEFVLPFIATDEFVCWAIDHGWADETRAWDLPILAKALRLIVAEAMAASRVTDGSAETAVNIDGSRSPATRRPTNARKSVPDDE
ncbi:hypothetical protein ACFSOZ_30775 [Mesorhizobium newzealandense]|uniref:Uncharacterized protein n=1 Tax=Mesorhizobium newzealandense TaxID=1300302 RepID=A0ABW4UKB4_9HYPH